jgi:hypothetical protein
MSLKGIKVNKLAKGDGDIFKHYRPTSSSKGTTKFENEDYIEEEQKKYPRFDHCLQCGFPNQNRPARCAFCEAPNWLGQYR